MFDVEELREEGTCVHTCQYAIDIGIPEYTCTGKCKYEDDVDSTVDLKTVNEERKR